MNNRLEAVIVFLQVFSGGRLDLLSLLIGLVLGVLLAWLAMWAAPAARQVWDRVAGRLQEAKTWLRSGVEKRYLLETATYLQMHHLGGRRATLDQIFVEPWLLAPEPELDPQSPIDLTLSHLHYVWPDLVAGVAVPPPSIMPLRHLLLNGRRVVLSGQMGAGKTTLLAYCAHICANASDVGPYAFLQPVLPIFLHLAECDLETNRVDSDVIFPLTRALQRRLGALGGQGIEPLLRQKLTAGHALLLLDGWDDFPARGQSVVVDWLRRLLQQYPDTRVMLAAPLRGYGSLLELGFTVTGLLSWRLSQAEMLATCWAEALGQPKALSVERYWRPGHFPLESTLRLLLATNADGADRPATPQRWVDLMEASLLSYLPPSGHSRPWLAPALRHLWQQVAHRLLVEERYNLPAHDLNSIIQSLLAEYEVSDRGAAQLLQNTTLQSGLFVQWPDQSLSFLSPVWRDFLAAAHLAHLQGQAPVQQLKDPNWAQVLRFYVGRMGATELAPLLLADKGTDLLHEGLFQAVSWLPETFDKGDWRRQILVQLGQLIIKTSQPQALRQRAAFALVQTGESGVLTLLRQLLRPPDPFLRQVVIAAVASLGGEVALEILEKMATDAEADVRQTAVHALAWLHHPATENPLLMALLDRDDVVSRAAAEGLALNGGEGWQILQEALADDMLHVRRTAVHGLAMLDQYWIVELLEKVEQEDEQWVVKLAAGAALEEIATRNRPADWRPRRAGDYGWLIDWAAAQGRAVPAAATATPLILEILTDADEAAIRVAAALTLGRLAEQTAIPILRSALADSAVEVRDAALLALCRIGRAHDLPLEITPDLEATSVAG